MSTVKILAEHWELAPGTKDFMDMCELMGPMLRIDFPDGRIELFSINDDFVCLTQTH